MARINITIPDDVLKILDEQAKKSGLSRSAYIRVLIISRHLLS